MSKNKKNAAAEAVVALQSDYNAKLSVLNGLDESVTSEDRQKAQNEYDQAKDALDAALKLVETSNVQNFSKENNAVIKGVFLLSPTGRFNLAYNTGEEAELPKLQAEELKAAGFFQF